MIKTIVLGEIIIEVEFKNVKNVHLSVHPPNGNVRLVAPLHTRLDVARAYAITKLPWIKAKREEFKNQERLSEREYVTRESHYVWGRRYLLHIEEKVGKPQIILEHKRLVLQVRPNTTTEKKKELLHQWHKALLHEEIPQLIKKWEPILHVTVNKYFVQKMKTRWGGCNPKDRNIRLNTELVKKPKDLLEYVIVHEMAHLIEPTHNANFITLLDTHYPTWRNSRKYLNDLPLSAELWRM